ncbi:MAG: S8 family serine peptidase, partial [Acidimicrobiales bacterium]
MLVLALVAGVLAAAPGSAATVQTHPPVVGDTDGAHPRRPSVLSPRLSRLTTSTMQARSRADRSAAVGLAPSGPGSLLGDERGYVVKIAVDDTSAGTRAALGAAGATIGAVDDGRHLIEATVAAGSLAAVGGVAGVRSVHEELTPRVVGSDPTGLGPGLTPGLTTDPTTASSTPVAQVASCNPVVTEGDAQVRAATARATYGLDGAGVMVGVLSDSYDVRGGAAAGVARGELPGPGNPCGHTTPVQVLQDSAFGGADEGRGMAELVHDLAPESPLAFASAFNGEMAFADNIRALAAAGAKVIVDDVSYYDEPMYQDGDIARAVDDVTAQGVTYYSSAGNENVLDSGDHEIGSYEAAAYRPTTCPAVTNGAVYDYSSTLYADCHDFDPGVGTSGGDTIQVDGGPLTVALGWNEPEYGVDTDFDVFVIDTSDHHIAAASQDAQDNSSFGHVPSEVLTFPYSGQFQIVVARFRNSSHPGGDTPKFKLIMFTGTRTVSDAQFDVSSGGDVIGPTIYGHNAALLGASVAAVPYNDSSTPEDYSSRGPATYCWAPVTGTTTPAAAMGCQAKPLDFAATDGGQTSFFYGSGPPFRFFGTSAAAPHAAAVGALMLDARPCATPAQVLAAQRGTARVVGTFGVAAVGSGLIDANAAVGALAACPTTTGTRYHPVNPTRVLESRPLPGNIGGFSTPWGPGVTRSVDVTDTGGSDVPATGVSAVVLNVTVTDTTTAGFLTVFPAGESTPIASNLNWSPGTTIANLVTVKVGAGGQVSFFNAAGSTNVIADVVGWYDTDAAAAVAGGTLYNPTNPTRVLESRPLPGNIGGYSTPWSAGLTRTLDVTGSSTGVVPPDATAVVLNVTVTDTTTAGFLTVFPADVTTVPTASNLNWSPGKTIPNLVTVKLGTGAAGTLGRIKIFNAAGNANVIADVVGYYRSTGAAFHPLSPVRIQESRFGTGNLVGRWNPGQTRSLDVTDTHGSGVPATGAQAVIMNVTVTDTTTAGFLTLFPASAS